MIKRFFNKVVLTSKNPEAFLNLVSEGESIWIVPTCNIESKMFYVNGIDISLYQPSIGYSLKFDNNYTNAIFHIYTEKNEKFDANLRFNIYDTSAFSAVVDFIDVSILNRPYIIPNNIIGTYENDNLLIDDEASYLLIRTNPKFTGNIAIYVDSSYNIFLDTIKVSDILSNKKYRHQQVSGNSILSGDIRNVFSSLPLGELYQIDKENTFDISIPKMEYRYQYNTTYNYGARLLKDELYSEDYGLMAPLWINSKLPDYFAIFRLDGAYNPESYNDASIYILAEKYLKNSKLIKSWSLKQNTPIGKYLNNHLSEIEKIQAPVFLSLTSPDLKETESDPNTWYGISVKKGILTGHSETTYFFNQVANNFTDLNAFVSKGFERNSLLCPNLLNLQFLFSDNDVSLYTMNRYFGFYLTENVLYKIAYYSDSSNGPVEILSLDGKNSSEYFNSSIFDTSGNIIEDFKNRIFVLNDGVQLKRITNVNQIDDSSINEYLNKPYENIFSTRVQQKNINPFILLTINNTLSQGEHLRVINKTQGKIWEAYSVNSSEFTCETYCTISKDPSHLTVYRTYFDIDGDISYQIKQIESAFTRFSNYSDTSFRVGISGDNYVSIVLNDDANFSDQWVFQRITASTLNKFDDLSSGFSSASSFDDISFFGVFTPNSSDFEIISYDSSYGPIDFELYGHRQSIMIDFFKRNNNYLYSFKKEQNIIDKFENPTLYQSTDLWYRRLLNFDVSNNSYQYIKDPVSLEDNVLIMTSKEIKTVREFFNAYSIWPLNISLMGINPVKDIDYTVYDQSLGYKSQYTYKRENDLSTYLISIDSSDSYMLDIPGSYVVKTGNGTYEQRGAVKSYTTNTLFNTFDSSAYFNADSYTELTYAVLDGSYNFKGYKNGMSGNEENISDYYQSNKLLKYGLIVPEVAKWVSLGNDCRNNPLRLILNSDVLEVSTNFIPYENNFTQEIAIPSFKYLTATERCWQDYVFYDINDVINDNGIYRTFKEMMFQHPYDDYFSKLLYTNSKVNKVFSRSSIVYYNQYKNSIDVLFMGLNLSIKVEDIAKNIIDIKTYNKYRFSFIATSSKNRDNKRPIEVIINENTKTILMIWYQGNDELNYNKRYSSFLPGKSILDASDAGFISGLEKYRYSFIKTPFIIRNDTVVKSIEYLYSDDEKYNDSFLTNLIKNGYSQFNKNLNGLYSSWVSWGNNSIINSTFLEDKNYQTFEQFVNYDYRQNSITYGNYAINYGYKYESNWNIYDNNTCNLDTLTYLLSPTYNYVMYYIIRENNVYTNYSFGSFVNPFTITINPPRKYNNIFTYNGWYKPKFNSILEFTENESSDLVNVTKKDFILNNTNIKSYNGISQLWYNKLTDKISDTDINNGNAIAFIRDFNVFKSLWDKNYYIMRENEFIDGYNSPYELPSFFGSKLPKFPDELKLENWNSTICSYSVLSSENKLNLFFNLTRAILLSFKNNATFLSNWSNFSNTDKLIDEYIKNTVITYYNISQSKIKVNFYYKSRDAQLLHYTLDSSDFVYSDKQNFDGQLIFSNNEYIYKIGVPTLGKFSYFVSFTLFGK